MVRLEQSAPVGKAPGSPPYFYDFMCFSVHHCVFSDSAVARLSYALVVMCFAFTYVLLKFSLVSYIAFRAAQSAFKKTKRIH